MYRGGNGSDWRVAFSRVPYSCRYRADQRRRENASIPVCLQILPLKSYVRILSLRGESILWSISTIFMSISIPGHSIRVGHHILRGWLCAKSIRRVFPRFREWSGEMFCRTAETNTAVENFSRPFSETGKNFFEGLCTERRTTNTQTHKNYLPSMKNCHHSATDPTLCCQKLPSVVPLNEYKTGFLKNSCSAS